MKKLHLVNWETITCPVNQGGLRILGLEDMNKALVAKWIFNYGNSKGSLWRKDVCACSKGDPDKLLPPLGNRGNNMVLLRVVNSILGSNNRARYVIHWEFRILVGNGQHADFW